MPDSKQHRLAIVTGASGGIGSAIAERLLDEGYAVALWDYNGEAVSKLATELGATGKPCIASQCDIANKDNVEAATAEAVARFGQPYLLVNNAATRHRVPLEDLPRESWDREIATNLTGTFQCTQTVGRLMLQQGSGVIVNMASAAAIFGQPFRGAYSASKAGILGLTNTIAVEWGPRGIRCNAISPGMMATPIHAATYADPQVREARQNMIPLRKLGDGYVVADVVLFLASDGARYLNGANIPVDGGWARNLLGLMAQPSSK